MGMVNFVSIFCLELQKLLKPIYDLTRKGSSSGEKSNKFPLRKLKADYKKNPVLCLSDRKGRFQLYSDTSKFASQSSLPM